MSGEKYFRSALGGFHKEDVLTYIEQQNETITELRKSLESAAKAAEEAEAAKARKIGELRDQISGMKQELDRANAGSAALKAELEASADREKELQEKLGHAEESILKKAEEYAALETLMKDRLSERDAREQQAAKTHENRIAEITADYEKRINSLTDEIVAVRSELTKCRAQLDRLTEREAVLLAARERLHAAKELMHLDAERLHAAGDETADAVERLADCMARLSAVIQKAQADASEFSDIVI